MGTHNALPRLGDKAYLGTIVIDPANGTTPSRPRWFDLDDTSRCGGEIGNGHG